jgi:hypothetical protein
VDEHDDEAGGFCNLEENTVVDITSRECQNVDEDLAKSLIPPMAGLLESIQGLH